MKTVFTLMVLALSLNVAIANDLGEGSADCTSLVQSNRSSDVVVTESADVQVSEDGVSR